VSSPKERDGPVKESGNEYLEECQEGLIKSVMQGNRTTYCRAACGERSQRTRAVGAGRLNAFAYSEANN